MYIQKKTCLCFREKKKEPFRRQLLLKPSLAWCDNRSGPTQHKKTCTARFATSAATSFLCPRLRTDVHVYAEHVQETAEHALFSACTLAELRQRWTDGSSPRCIPTGHLLIALLGQWEQKSAALRDGRRRWWWWWWQRRRRRAARDEQRGADWMGEGRMHWIRSKNRPGHIHTRSMCECVSVGAGGGGTTSESQWLLCHKAHVCRVAAGKREESDESPVLEGFFLLL